MFLLQVTGNFTLRTLDIFNLLIICRETFIANEASVVSYLTFRPDHVHIAINIYPSLRVEREIIILIEESSSYIFIEHSSG